MPRDVFEASEPSSLLFPCSTDEFVREYWQKKAFVSQRSPAWLASLGAVLPFDLPALLKRATLPISVWFETLEGGARIARAASAADAYGMYEAGLTIYFDIASREAVVWASAFGRLVGWPPEVVRVSVFATRRSRGTQAHFDTSETFTIQLSGEKRWRVSDAPLARNPPSNLAATLPPVPVLRWCNAEGAKIDPDQATTEYALAPGAVLYVPAGHVHATMASADSVSLAISFESRLEKTWGGFLSRVVDRLLVRREEMRAFASGVDGDDVSAEVRARASVALREAQAMVARLTIDDVFGVSAEDARRAFEAESGPVVRRNPLAYRYVRGADDASPADMLVEFGVTGRRSVEVVRLSPDKLGVVRWLEANDGETDLGALCRAFARVDASAMRELLEMLVRVGFVVCVGEGRERRLARRLCGGGGRARPKATHVAALGRARTTLTTAPPWVALERRPAQRRLGSRRSGPRSRGRYVPRSTERRAPGCRRRRPRPPSARWYRARMRSLLPIALPAAALLVSFPARADVLWRGDVETGDLSQFSGGPNQDQVTVVSSPARDGEHAARAELRNEDGWPNGLRRVELGYTPPAETFAGSERYYAFSVRASSDMPLVGGITNTIAYWESYPSYKQVMAFNVKDGKVSFGVWYPKPDGENAGELWKGDFAPSQWHDFVLRVKWSNDPAAGLVELWYDGEHVAPPTPVRTMVAGDGGVDPNFFHIGLLHGDFDAQPQAVFVDRVLEGTALQDVSPDAGAGGAHGGEAGAGGSAEAGAGGAAGAGSPGGASGAGGSLAAGAGGKPSSGASGAPSANAGSAGSAIKGGGAGASGGGKAAPAADTDESDDGGCATAHRGGSAFGGALGLAALVATARRRRARRGCGCDGGRRRTME